MIGVYMNKSWTWKFHWELFNVIFYSPITLDEQCTLFTYMYLVHLHALEDFV